MLPSILGTDDYHIEDSGELLGEFLSSLSDIESLQTVVFSGHVFHSLTLPAALPESITTLVFDSASARPV